MSNLEDFENAPFGATASDPNGRSAVKTQHKDWPWSLFNENGEWVDRSSSSHLARYGYVLNQTVTKTAREALDLAWELSYPVKEGQELPKGTKYIRHTETGLFTRAFPCAHKADSWDESNIRTLDQLTEPETEPEWLDALAVYATCYGCDEDGLTKSVHVPSFRWWNCTRCTTSVSWENLDDVTPLYPKETKE